MKLDKRQLDRALRDPAVRAWLFYGQDDSASLALADRIAPEGAERVDLDGATLKGDPARLADEAASSSLFGGARWIRVRASGDEVLAAVEALLEASETVNPVAIVAGDLKGGSKLLKLATASPLVGAFQSYMPGAREAVPLVQDLAAAAGLRVRPDVAQRIFDAAAGDRAVIAQELAKIALYIDADPARPCDLPAAALDAIGAGEGETSPAASVDAALTGDLRGLAHELRALGRGGDEGVPLLRATLRRLLQLADWRLDADRRGLEPVLRTVFWKDKGAVEAELRRWPAHELAKLVERVSSVQAALLSAGTAGPVLVTQELLVIARAAARGR